MRQSVLTLWFATFLTFFVPVLSCRQRAHVYYKEFADCNEGTQASLQDHMTAECAKLGQEFKDLNQRPEMQFIFGRDITAELSGLVYLPPDNSNCVAWTCTVTAWRYREWETTMENRALPSVPGWVFHNAYYDEKVKC